jgi:hypothetical protein
MELGAAPMLEDLLRRTHLSAPHQLAEIVSEAAEAMGARQTVLYVIDYELKTLIPVPAPSAAEREPLSVAGTVAGRAFRQSSIVEVRVEPSGGRRLWLPLLDGTERMGVMELTFPQPADALEFDTVRWGERYAHAVAMLMVSKGAYSDWFEVLRRRRTMTIAAELVRDLMPPLVFATDQVAIAGLLEPAYETGGDALDFALNGDVLHFAVFDAMGHGLAAAGMSALALSAYRNTRRSAASLADAYAAMDAAVWEAFPDTRFVTALIARLDVPSGRLQWVSAGHPAPLLLRGNRSARPLVGLPAPPLGLQVAAGPPAIQEESLEPGDQVLLYTDGLTEARRPGGDLFTVERLAEFLERQASERQTPPETLRRLREAIIERQEGALRDDATALLVDWHSGRSRDLLPQTV